MPPRTTTTAMAIQQPRCLLHNSAGRGGALRTEMDSDGLDEDASRCHAHASERDADARAGVGDEPAPLRAPHHRSSICLRRPCRSPTLSLARARHGRARAAGLRVARRAHDDALDCPCTFAASRHAYRRPLQARDGGRQCADPDARWRGHRGRANVGANAGQAHE